MTNEQKIELADRIIELYKQFIEEAPKQKVIGMLNKATGINGYKLAQVGTPVIDVGSRYIIILETLDGKRNIEIPYYKETLSPIIDFYEQNV